MYWQVALLSPPYSDLTYSYCSYFPNEIWQKGQRVVVPLGKSLRLAVLLQTVDCDLPAGKIKSLFWPLEKKSLFTEGYLQFVAELAKRQLQTPGRILGRVLPAGLKRSEIFLKLSHPSFPRQIKLSSLRDYEPEKKQLLAELWMQDQVGLQKRTNFQDSTKFYAVAKDPPWPILPGAIRQNELLEYLWENGPQPWPILRSRLGNEAGQPLKTLLKKGLIQIESDDDFVPDSEPIDGNLCSLKPTKEQEQTLDFLLQDLISNQPCTRLLYGITGSGKTFVYLRLAKACLQKGYSVLLLVPEVALALNLWETVRSCFSEQQCFLYHGYQSPKKREDIFVNTARSESPKLIVGTRSALFLPLKDLGLIVLDEEHDESFKQDEGLGYQAKELAYYLVNLSRGLLLLGSATPDMKTFYASQSGTIPLLEMKQRVGQSNLPEVNVLDLRNNPPAYGPFSRQCHQRIQEVLAKDEQVIILLNRRGYASMVYCTGCGQVARCPNCDVGLTYYKTRERLLCHYCGLSLPFPLVCSGCQGFQYVPLGEGTEQIEEYLSSQLAPDMNVLRLDRDTTRRQGRMEEILNQFAQKKAQILVGTQMLSKGHHFPDVTLVVVADGDVGLNLPDYRASERTFQLLVQVGGRAGRGDKPGEVLIQSRNPDHYCWQYVSNNDYKGFYEQEIELRRRRNYPPFVKLGLLRISYPVDLEKGISMIQETAKLMRSRAKELALQVLGPAPAPLGRLRGRMRYQCLIKSGDWQRIRALYAYVLEQTNNNSQLRISLDLDPVQML
jgi:primosomal protein N' (replication factor Y)